MLDIVWDVLLDSFLDTLKLFPFLVLIYVLIEFMEQKTNIGAENSRLKGNLGVLFGAATGVVPQCGFSVMAAKLYDKGMITLGTLLAIFISTSDEALIVLLSSGTGAVHLLPMVLVKILVGVGVGYAVAGVEKLLKQKSPEPVKISKADYHARVLQKKEEGFCTSCGRDHDEENVAKTYFLDPLLHSLKVAAYIFVVTAAFGFIVEAAGEENLVSFLSGGVFVQPFVAAAIGLIPNCASSVVITQSYLLGHLTFAGCAAGLCTNAGLGFVVLLRNTKKWKRNLLLIAGMYVIGVLTGLILTLIQLWLGII